MFKGVITFNKVFTTVLIVFGDGMLKSLGLYMVITVISFIVENNPVVNSGK
jgi:hypothetical protein